MNTPEHSCLIGSSSFLQATRTCITTLMRFNFNQITPLTRELPALVLLNGSYSFLQVTRTTIRSRMSSNFGQIRPWTAELDAIERLKKIAIDLQREKYCEHSSAFIFDLIFFVPAGNKDMHKSLDEFEFQPDPTTDYRVNCPLASEEFMYNVVNTLAPSFLILSFSFLHETRPCIKACCFFFLLNFGIEVEKSSMKINLIGPPELN